MRFGRQGSGDRDLLAWAGVIGPVAFVADWAVLGAMRSDYSPVNDAISRLAELHAPTRPAMTAGFVVYGAGLLGYSVALRDHGGRAWMFAAATGVTTFGVAAFALGSPTSGDIHAVFAGLGYATLAGVPLASSAALRSGGHRGSARASVAVGMAVAALLLGSVVIAPGHGLTQRAGLTLGDMWIVLSAAHLLRQRRGPVCGP